jgi:uncharacterized protein GlcG (DUF336 family)
LKIIVTKIDVAQQIAVKMVQDALDHVASNCWQVAVAVYDPTGNLVALGR